MDLKVYCLVDVNKPPQELTVHKGQLSYKYNVGAKNPQQLVVFAFGSWDVILKNFQSQAVLSVQLQTKNGSVLQIGHLNFHHRCLSWEGEWSSKKNDITETGDTDGDCHVVVTVTPHQHIEEDGAVINYTAMKTKENTPVASNPSTKIRPTSNSPKRLTNKKKERVKRYPALPSSAIRSELSDNKENTVNDNSDEVERNTVAADVAEVTTTGGTPTTRWGHTLSMLTDTTAVMVGGQGPQKNLRKDSLWMLDIEANTWSILENKTSGARPDVRMGHAAAYDPVLRCIYIHGGSKNLRWFNDIHMLDVDQWQWQAEEVTGNAPTRSYHSLTLYRHELWVFGGVYPQSQNKADVSSNDIHVISLTNRNWYTPIVMGEKPLPRSGHSATLLGDQLVVFGGWDFPVVYNDLSVLDMRLVEWTKPKTVGKPPSVRSWHASCALSYNRVIIHGGYDGNVALKDAHLFNLDTLSWTELEFKNSIDSLFRTGHAAFCLPYYHGNENEDKVYIVGGGDNNDLFFNDIHHITIPLELPK